MPFCGSARNLILYKYLTFFRPLPWAADLGRFPAKQDAPNAGTEYRRVNARGIQARYPSSGRTSGSGKMSLKRSLFLSAAAIGIAGCFSLTQAGAQGAVPVKKNEIGGTVSSPHGPEAGVWVIAETHDTPTRFARMVVTDDQGRYLVPDLPAGHYKVWVRGYGLVDSAKVDADPGKALNLSAVIA